MRQEAAARSQAEEACTEAISQVCAWLDSTERLLAAEPTSWLAPTELKTKIQKLKVSSADRDVLLPKCCIRAEASVGQHLCTGRCSTAAIAIVI